MSARLWLLSGLVLCSCLDDTAVNASQSRGFGGIDVHFFYSGYRVSNIGADSIIVALDSAIQGYGVKQMYSNADSSVYVPVLSGLHEVVVRGFPASCVITATDTRSGGTTSGRTRTVEVVDNLKTRLWFTVSC